MIRLLGAAAVAGWLVGLSVRRGRRLGQRIAPPAPPPAIPAQGAPDPVSEDLARQIREAYDELMDAWVAYDIADKEYDRVMATRVGLAPQLYRDPRALADPTMERAFYAYFDAAEEYEAARVKVIRLQEAFRDHLAWRWRMGLVPGQARRATIPVRRIVPAVLPAGPLPGPATGATRRFRFGLPFRVF